MKHEDYKVLKENNLSASKFEELWEEVIKQRDENIERQRHLEAERSQMLKYFEDREKKSAENAERLRKELELRERHLAEELNTRAMKLAEENKKQADRFEAMRDIANEKNFELSKREEDLKEKTRLFSEEKDRYDQENNIKLQSVSDKYVGGVIKDLKLKEKSLSDISFGWAVFGGLSLFVGLVFATLSAYQNFVDIPEGVSGYVLTLLTLKGTVFIAISGIISRYAFVLSKRYLNESLRISDVIHNVSFGQLFVQSYGSAAGWDQVKDAFSKWHHSDKSAVPTKSDEDEVGVKFDMPQFNQIIDAIKAIKG